MSLCFLRSQDLLRCPHTETVFGDDKDLVKGHCIKRPVSVPLLVDVAWLEPHRRQRPRGDLIQ